ncbi:MAG TPA: VWA domain-containing protein [Bacteroidia bacterium]|nr:VWA domain-containing protein [Bacteroidia bacterium]
MIGWWHTVTFAQPWALWLLLVIPVIAVLLFIFGGRGRPALQISSLRFFAGVKKPAVVKWRPVLYVLRLLALGCLITAFARPQSKLAWKKNHGEGIDIMLSIDVSTSMDGTDFVPNRLEAAKEQANRFIDTRPDDRIGVVVFSGEAYSLCPLTTDHEALKYLVSNASHGSLDDGTAIGMGLAKAVERLEESEAKSRVVILLTDGENNAGAISPEDAARLAKTYGIRVYIIGLGGTSGQVLQPSLVNPDGSYVMTYQPVNIDEKALIDMATLTGGKYFRASDNERLKEIYDAINKMEKTKFDKEEAQQRKEEFLPLLFWVAFLLGLELLLRYTLFDSLT